MSSETEEKLRRANRRLQDVADQLDAAALHAGLRVKELESELADALKQRTDVTARADLASCVEDLRTAERERMDYYRNFQRAERELAKARADAAKRVDMLIADVQRAERERDAFAKLCHAYIEEMNGYVRRIAELEAALEVKQ